MGRLLLKESKIFFFSFGKILPRMIVSFVQFGVLILDEPLDIRFRRPGDYVSQPFSLELRYQVSRDM